MTSLYDVIVIGEGPAGMSACLYLKRANLNLLLIEKSSPGGKMLWTSMIDNYPGFKKDSGIELAQIMYEQLKEEKVKKVHTEVKEVVKEPDGTFTITTNKGLYFAKYVIFSGGTKVKKLNVPGEKEYYGRGVSYCALCDGGQYRGKNVVVIGGGRSSFGESVYLSKICNSVTIVARGNIKAPLDLQEKVFAIPNIKVLTNKTIVSFTGDEELKQVTIQDKETHEKQVIDTDAVFVYIGFIPTSSVFDKYHLVDEKGYIYVDEERETKVPGLYAAGDCIHKSNRQVITAVADGVIAANAIIRKI